MKALLWIGEAKINTGKGLFPIFSRFGSLITVVSDNGSRIQSIKGQVISLTCTPKSNSTAVITVQTVTSAVKGYNTSAGKFDEYLLMGYYNQYSASGVISLFPAGKLLNK